MTNIVKQTLVEKREALERQAEALYEQKAAILLARPVEFFKDILEAYPEVEVKLNWDTIYFHMSGKEILTINQKGFEKVSFYLNTYSTWIDSNFELRRLAFNGLIAQKLYLGDMQEICADFFAEDGEVLEVLTEYRQVRNMLWELQKEINTIETLEKLDRDAAKERQVRAGEEIVLEKEQTITYGSSRYDYVRDVKALKAEMTSKLKCTVHFTCRTWKLDEEMKAVEGPDTVITRENIHIKKLLANLN